MKDPDTMRSTNEATDAQRQAEHEGKLKGLKQMVADVQSGMYINCVYCGHRYGPKGSQAATVKDGLPMAEALKAHIEQCPEHPMFKLKVELEKLRETGLLALLQWEAWHNSYAEERMSESSAQEEQEHINRCRLILGDTQAERRALTQERRHGQDRRG